MTLLNEKLFRHTDLPSLLYLLKNKTITLLDPSSWDDANDSRFLAIYKERKSLGTVLALCFTRSTETYHHWRIFSHGVAGVRITFDRKKLLRAVRDQQGFRHGDVAYRKIEDLSNRHPKLNELPFLKRWPYEPEQEFRIIYEGQERIKSLDVRITISCIERITLSPWLNKNVVGAVREHINSIPGASK